MMALSTKRLDIQHLPSMLILCAILMMMGGTGAMAAEAIYPKTPAGEIEIKELPVRTGLVVPGESDPFTGRDENFRKLFKFIKENDVAMTVPVEAGAEGRAMSFYAGSEVTTGTLASTEQVKVESMPTVTVLSAGARGSYTQERYEEGKKALADWLAAHPEWEAVGSPYAVYWNAPFMPGIFKRSEVHQVIREAASDVPPLLAIPVTTIDGRETTLEEYKGKVLLIVNVASKCGFTGQYEGLEKLYDTYSEQGLVVLGFPSNDFLGQEPGSNEEIATFCRSTYGVSFPMYAKITVKGDGQHPLYRHLTESIAHPEFAGKISWNFNKFLVGRDGQIVGRFGSRTAPEDAELIQAIEAALAIEP